MADEPLLDAPRIAETLDRHGVAHVMIGALAATFHGSPLRTSDVDICPKRDRPNLERLAAALVEMEAKLRSPAEPLGVPFVIDADTLDRAETWTLVTRHGNLDISFTPSGTEGYRDLIRHAVALEVDGVRVTVASLLDVIRSKEAAARPKDLSALPTLRALLERTEDGR